MFYIGIGNRLSNIYLMILDQLKSNENTPKL